MDDSFKINIEQLNNYLDIDSQELSRYTDLHKKILYGSNHEFAYKTKKIKQTKIGVINRKFNEDEIKKIILDFYENLDIDMYKSAKKILTGQDDFIKISIYEKNNVENLIEPNKDFPTYLEFPTFLSANTTITLPNNKKAKIAKDVSKIYVPLNGEIQDIYRLAHELAHTFDYSSQSFEKKFPREILGEVTPAFIENLLDDYLLENNYISENEVLNRRKEMHIEIKKDALINITRMELVFWKEKNGEITEKTLNEYIDSKKMNLNTYNLQRMCDDFFNRRERISYMTRYVIAQFISTYIYSNYKRDTNLTMKQLKNYFMSMKENNFWDSLKNINVDLENTDPLIDARNEYLDDIIRRENKIYDKYNGER